MELPSKYRIVDVDWVCDDSECGNVNFARRLKCVKCNKERACFPKKKHAQEIGKAGAEKSRGLFSADDWICIKCDNVNWARRTNCNLCNTSKCGDVEERTGYGGGYNDRGVVEYVSREDSDDEYDEFGRKKRKSDVKKNDCKEDGASSVKYRKQESGVREPADEEEEEDDDDDGDEDLSKYDLTGWDDLPITESTTKDEISSNDGK